jgi:hypothetical protein
MSNKEPFFIQIERDLCYRCLNYYPDVKKIRSCTLKEYLTDEFKMCFNHRSAPFINYFFPISPENGDKLFCKMFIPDRIKPPRLKEL